MATSLQFLGSDRIKIGRSTNAKGRYIIFNNDGTEKFDIYLQNYSSDSEAIFSNGFGFDIYIYFFYLTLQDEK